MTAATINPQTNKIFMAVATIAVLNAAVAVQPAFALDRTWVGHGYWDVARNWSPAGLPGSGDRAIINGGVSILSFNTSVAGLELARGELGGSGRLTVTGPGIWNGGDFTGPGATHFAGPLYISGNPTKTIGAGRTISVTDSTWDGNTAVDSNAIRLGFGPGGTSSIINMGTWNDSNTFNTQISGNYMSPSTFHNVGTYNKQGNGSTIIGANYNGTGTTNVNAGSLLLGGGGSSIGAFNIGTNSTLELTHGTHNLDGATITGAGTFHIRGNSIVNVNGGKHAAPVVISENGQLQGDNHNFEGPATWTGGSIKGDGLTRFGDTLSITGDLEKTIDGGHIVGVRDTTWGGNTRPNSNMILFNFGFTINDPPNWIVSSGTWNDTNAFDSTISGRNSAFHNGGTYHKQGNATTIMDAEYNNTGITWVSAGKMIVSHSFSNSGEILVSAGATFQVLHVTIVSTSGINSETDTKFENAMSGVVRGPGTVITPPVGLINRGAINPGYLFGGLTIEGDLHQAASGVLNIDLFGLDRFDHLIVTDDVTLGGTLAVRNQGYTPVIGDKFVVATFDERLAASTFSSVVLSGFGPGMNIDVIYNEHNITLAVTAAPSVSSMPAATAAAAATAVPEPEAWALLLAGLSLVRAVAGRRRTA